MKRNLLHFLALLTAAVSVLAVSAYAQVEMPDIGVCGPTGKRSGTRRRDHDQRMARTAFDDELDHADARRVEPLQVVDDDDARPGGGQQSVRVTGGDLRQR